MHWGNLLLWGWEDLKEAFTNGIGGLIYQINNLIVSFLYFIWRVLAFLVSGVESIFKNLAGLDTGENDVVQGIINDDRVDKIFLNLLSFAMAMIIFFTIVKIIQDHYKEKDGGNPYKIVFRTFKGLLMFFFVQAAVVVGLYASRVVFKALDAATSSGSTSLSGQVFKSMASGANRKRIGKLDSGDEWFTSVKNKYWTRIADPQYATNDGKYMIVEKKTDTQTAMSPAALRQEYLNAFPAYRYGIVSPDGKTVTPLASWMQSQSVLGTSDYQYDDDIKQDLIDNGFGMSVDYWNKGSVDGWETDDFESTGDFGGSVGYENDILKGVDVSIKPKISLNWSPIDIWTYGNGLVDAHKVEFDQNITVLGTGYLIKMSLQFVKYSEKPVVTEKSLEESAKVFGISINGSVGLQDNKASAKFSLNTYSPNKFKGIMQSILVNVLYTNLAQKILELIPALPVRLNISALSIDYLQLFAPVILDMLETSINTVMATNKILPVDEDGKLLVTPFSTGSSKTSSGVWLVINPNSKYLTTTIEQYKISANFTDLWSQLMTNFDDLMTQLEKSNEESWSEAKMYQELLGRMDGKIMDQSEWASYMGKVNQYNDKVRNGLVNLAQMLYLHTAASGTFEKAEERDQYLASEGYRHTFAELENNIKRTFRSMVDNYNSNIVNTAPSSNYADPKITMPIYQPIVEFGISNSVAESMTPTEIRDYLAGDTSKGRLQVNMVINESGELPAGGSIGAYRMVDWKKYGLDSYAIKFKDYADLYYTGGDVEDAVHLNSSLADLNYITINDEVKSSWEAQDLGYFTQFSGSEFAKNSTKNDPTILSKHKLEPNSYWSNKGVVCPAVQNDPYYVYYSGTRRDANNVWDKVKKKVDQDETQTASVDSAEVGTVRTSSANLNTMTAEGQTATAKEIAALADVDYTTADATEFSKHILTFRPLYTTADETNEDKGDIRVMDEMVEVEDKISLMSGSTVNALYKMTAGQIDDYMADKPTNCRRYLALSQKGTVEPSSDNLGSYIGQFSYSDTTTVNALYDYGSMNYAAGFIAIIAAMGVYLNFAFGLIQRAVNMAVLYVMSPITIAFYPFDDGQRFNQHFVSAFYKEAISAYAIIISLNLFIVMLDPVRTAVMGATGNWLLGWLALVAFVSMLPKIRDSITSILGANSISAKKLSDVWKDAGNALGNPLKKVAGFSDAVRSGYNSAVVHRQANRQKEIDELEQKKANGELNWWGQQRLEKLKNRNENSRLGSQKRIDEALQTGDTSKLSEKEKKRYNRQRKAAEIEANANVKRRRGESDEEHQARVAAEKKRLLDDPKFKRSVNGVLADTKFGRAARKVSGGLSHAKDWVANSSAVSMAKTAGRAISNSVVGEMFKGKYGIKGSLTKDKNSAIGAINRWFNKEVQKNDRKDVSRKDLSYEMAANSHNDALIAASSLFGQKTTEADNAIAAGAKKNLARQVVAGSGKTTEEKLADLKTAEYLRQGKTMSEAQTLVSNEMAQLRTNGVNLDTEYIKLGGDEKYAAGLADNLKEFRDLSIKLDLSQFANELAAAETALRTKASNNAKAIQSQIDDEKDKRKINVQKYAEDIAKGMGKNDAATTKALVGILTKADQTTSFAEIMNEIKGLDGVDAVDAEKALTANYQGFAHDVQFNHEIDDLKTALSASKANAKAEEMFRNKLGYEVNQAETDDLLVHFRNVNDGNLNSINPESLGYQQRQKIEEYKATGGLKDPQCQKEVEELAVRMKAELSSHMQSYADRNAEAIRQHDIAQKFNQNMMSVPTLTSMTEYQHQREVQIGMNMDVPTLMTMFSDSSYQRMHDDGDYAGSGRLIQQLVTAVKQHDDETAYSLDFDKKTVDTLKQWESQGQIKRLDSLYDLGVMDASHMGSTLVDMGGSSMQQVETNFARLTSVAEKNILINKLNTSINASLNEETAARSTVNQVLNSIDAMFSGKEWEGLYGKIKDIHGNVATNKEELIAALKDNLSAVNDETRDFYDTIIQENLEAINNFRAEKNDLNITNTCNYFTQTGMGSARLGVQKGKDVISQRDVKSTMEGGVQEIMGKMKPLETK